MSLCVHSCRSTTVWTTWPRSLWKERTALCEPSHLAFSVQLVQGQLDPRLPRPVVAAPSPAAPPSDTTHTTGTVTAHQMFVKGLFLHRGLVRCTWVMEMKTGRIDRWGVKAPTGPKSGLPPRGFPISSQQPQ